MAAQELNIWEFTVQNELENTFNLNLGWHMEHVVIGSPATGIPILNRTVL